MCDLLQIYDEDELLQAKLDILSKTNMIDYTIDIRKQLYPNIEVPEVCFIAFPYVYVCTLYWRLTFCDSVYCAISRYAIRIKSISTSHYLLQEIKARRADVLQELQLLQNNVSVVLALMNNEEVMKKMENMRDSKALNNYLTQESDVRNMLMRVKI